MEWPESTIQVCNIWGKKGCYQCNKSRIFCRHTLSRYNGNQAAWFVFFIYPHIILWQNYRSDGLTLKNKDNFETLHVLPSFNCKKKITSDSLKSISFIQNHYRQTDRTGVVSPVLLMNKFVIFVKSTSDFKASNIFQKIIDEFARQNNKSFLPF